MPGSGNLAETPRQRRERILAACVEACEREGREALERFSADHPDLAEEMRGAVRAALELRAASSDAEGTSGGIPRPGATIGKYRLKERLGGGGMGVLFRARDPALDRDVAIKVLAAPLSTIPGALERFRREARAVAHLHHPHVVAVHDVGETLDGLPYMVMDLVEGESFEAILRRLGGADPRRLHASDLLPTSKETGERPTAAPGAASYVEAVVRLVAKVADAVDHAHRTGVIHRDVKPGNILVDAEGEPRLVDFGVARDLQASVLTQTGSAPGTPYYMSPEQIAGGRTAIDARTDVFSLGATLYEALTLQRPFRGDTTAQVFRQVLWKEPVRPRRLNPGIPADLETVCLKALEKDPEHRYATAGLFAEDLKSLLELRPIRARPAGPITRTTKWVRRNRPAAAAIVVVAASLFASVGFFAQGEWAKRTEIRGELARAGQHVEQRRYDAALECVARVLVLAPGHPTAVRLKTEIQGKMAGEALEEAQATIEEFRRGAREESELSPEALNLRVEQTVAAIPANQQEGLLKLENILSRKRLDLETLFYSALEKLNRAGRLAPNDPLRARLLADLYVERLRELDGRGDVEASRFFTGLLRRYHPDRFLEEEIKNRGSVAFVTNPPGAQVFLFRYVERSEFIEGGEPRLVPVPFDGQGASFPYPPGTWALRVARGAGSIERQDLLFTVGGFPIRETVLATEANEKLGIRPFDRLVSIDGHPIRDEHEVRQWGVDYEHKFALAQPYAALPPRRFEMERAGEGRFHFDLRSATDVGVEFRVARHIAEIGGVEAEVYHLGELRTAALQPGLEVRPTAAPLLLCSRSDFGTTPTDVRSLRSGSYLALVRLAAYEDLRLPFFLRRDCESVIELDLLPEGTSPEGFVYIPPGAWIGGGDPDTVASEPLEERTSEEFWMMEREMTACDYLPFLNDEVIVARRLASPIAILAPREEIQTSWDGEVWRECRRPDGRYELPERVLEQTLQGISWHDAKEYAEWRTRRAALEGDRFVFELPTHEEWEKAARGADGRSFVFGNRFVPWWSSTRTARRQHTRHDPMSFPVDESPFGVFDLGGNQSEWCIPSLDRYGNPFHTRGGSHINPRPSDFRLAGRNDELPGNVRTYIGFRLVARLRQ